MQVNSIFLDPKSLEETGGMYGVVAGQPSSMNAQMRFSDQYIDKAMLVDHLQQTLNAIGADLCEMPEGADRVACTAEWRRLKLTLDEIRNL